MITTLITSAKGKLTIDVTMGSNSKSYSFRGDSVDLVDVMRKRKELLRAMRPKPKKKAKDDA